MYAQQPQNAIQIRNDLLSSDSDLQDQASRRLGYTRPHVELVAIVSAISLDVAAEQPALTPRLVRRLCNATLTHLATIEYHPASHVRADVAGKALDVAHAVTAWWMLHARGDVLLKESAQALTTEVERLWAACKDIPHVPTQEARGAYQACEVIQALVQMCRAAHARAMT